MLAPEKEASIPSKAAQRCITILGATGSVGDSTLDLVRQLRAREGANACRIEALTANTNVDGLAKLCREFQPRMAVVADESQFDALKAALSGTGVEPAAGADAVVEAAQRPADWVMAAIVGAAGLRPTLAAAERGADVALANKESLVCSGDLLTDAVERAGGALLPVDSEHNAIFQVLSGRTADQVEQIILTASGGPFRERSLEEMEAATPEQAVAHPVWSMGAKISVDSATLMNKGLELIEAYHLFAVEPRQLGVVVHPQSIVHSLVEYIDGSVLAQLGSPDMRVPIASALAWPQRIPTNAQRLNLASIATLTFEEPDAARFPALRLAREAMEEGGFAPAVLNAANEIAVASFLDRRIGFLDISRIVEQVLDKEWASGSSDRSTSATLGELFEIDRAARAQAELSVKRLSS